MPDTTIATLTFDLTLSPNETPFLRGAINKAAGRGRDVLWHNHTTDGLRYAYPLVQYKAIDGRATLVGIGPAADDLDWLAAQRQLSLRIGTRQVCASVADYRKEAYTFALDDAPKHYSLRRYLPLTGENFDEYNRLLALTDRLTLLERMLTGNILSFLKGINVTATEQIFVAITEMEKPYKVTYKDISFLAFDLDFVTNAALPSLIGLGKSSSVGFGTLFCTNGLTTNPLD